MEDSVNLYKKKLMDDLCVMMGGRIAEELMFGEMSAGASNDIERATGTARAMVCRWGMSEKLGPLAFGNPQGEVFLGRDLGSRPDYSEDTARQIDSEVRGIVMGSYERGKKLLMEHLDALKRVADALIEYETIDAVDLETLMQGGVLTREKPAPASTRPPNRKKRRAAAFSTRSTACRARWSRKRRKQLAALVLGDRSFVLGDRTLLMGVVNVTPDSFSDGGRFFSATAAVVHGVELAKAGADILDIGGESTRPGAEAVSAADELGRVIPVIEGLRRALPGVPLSIDTSKAEVAERALAAGATMVNDITGLLGDSRLAGVAARANAALCVMHMQGTPRTMQKNPRYVDVVEEVFAWLQLAVERATRAGVAKDNVLIDPGIGFGKTLQHNLQILKHLNRFRALGQPVLMGTSRKAFLGALTGGKPADQRVVATAATVAVMAAMGGADVVRVHDVAEARDAAVVGDAIRRADV